MTFEIIERGGTWDKYYDSDTNKYKVEGNLDYVNYLSGSSYHPIDTTVTNKSLTVSGRDYSFGVEKGIYKTYWRNQFSDTKDRPIAMVWGDFTLTYSPVDFIIFSPHKGTTEGKVGNRVQSDAISSGNSVTYTEAYDKIGTTGSFADLSFEYWNSYIKEKYIISDKAYIQDRYTSQCNATDYATINLIFSSIIRMYETDDLDTKTAGIVYGSDKVSFKEYGLTANGTITTTDEIYFTDSVGDIVCHIPKIFAEDSEGNRILLTKQVSMTDFSNLRIDVLVPYSWLNETAVFPVIIDPDTGAIAPGSASGWTDCDVADLASDNNNYVNQVIGPELSSPVLYVYNFNFATPVPENAASIDGIVATMILKTGAATTLFDGSIYLTLNGSTTGGVNKLSATKWPTAEVTRNYGTSTDIWSSGYSVANIRSSGFGLYIIIYNANADVGATGYYDLISMTVYYTAGVTGVSETDGNRKPAIYLDSSKNIGSSLDMAKSQYLYAWDFTSTDTKPVVKLKTKDFGS